MNKALPDISFRNTRNSGFGSTTVRNTGFAGSSRDYGGTPLP